MMKAIDWRGTALPPGFSLLLGILQLNARTQWAAASCVPAVQLDFISAAHPISEN